MKIVVGFNFLLLLLVTLSSCRDKDAEVIGPGRVTVSLNTDNIRFSDGARIAYDIEDAHAILVSIETHSGDLIHDLKLLSIHRFGDAFISEELELLSGTYRVTRFLVVDDSNNVLYATPLTGSELAHLVGRPLPVEFTVSEGVLSEIEMEVVSTAVNLPEDFGYVAFELKPTEAKAYNVRITIADEDISVEPSGTMNIIAKDENGVIQWSSSHDAAGIDVIHIPLGYARYSFLLSRPGYISHNQHYLYTDIDSIETLSFELIPEESDDFVIHELLNGNLTVYYPADKAKLYTRVDLAENFRLDYLWIDKDFSDGLGVPLGLLQLREHFDAKLQRASVNLFDNVPFNLAPDQRSRVEMNPQEHRTDFERDVMITSFLAFDYNETFEVNYFSWFYDQQAFFDYWCPVPGFGYLCDSETISASDSWMSGKRMRMTKDREITPEGK